jgi:hypothetical protein
LLRAAQHRCAAARTRSGSTPSARNRVRSSITVRPVGADAEHRHTSCTLAGMIGATSSM